MTALETAIAGIRLGNPVTLANLTLFPLLGGASGEPAYLTLGEALAAGQARITVRTWIARNSPASHHENSLASVVAGILSER